MNEEGWFERIERFSLPTVIAILFIACLTAIAKGILAYRAGQEEAFYLLAGLALGSAGGYLAFLYGDDEFDEDTRELLGFDILLAMAASPFITCGIWLSLAYTDNVSFRTGTIIGGIISIVFIFLVGLGFVVSVRYSAECDREQERKKREELARLKAEYEADEKAFQKSVRYHLRLMREVNSRWDRGDDGGTDLSRELR